MLGDALHFTGGSSGAASCASTTAAWLGRLKVGLMVGSIDQLFQQPTKNGSCGGGVDTGENLEYRDLIC